MQILSAEVCKRVEGRMINIHHSDVIRVNHTLSPERLAEAGRDVEAQVLARAVTWHAEHRVLLNQDRTVVFH